jgi:hypothetical protein
MKKLFIIMLLALITITSCVTELTEVTKVIRVTEGTISDTGLTIAVDQVIFPDPGPSQSIAPSAPSNTIDYNTSIVYEGVTYYWDSEPLTEPNKLTSYNSGKFYKESTKDLSDDPIITTLDLSDIVGNRKVLVAIEVNHLSASNTGIGNYLIPYYFKGTDTTNKWTETTVNTNENDIVFLLTDNNGCIDWYSNNQWSYFPFPTANYFHVSNWVNVEVKLCWYSVGFVVSSPSL